MKLSEGLGIGLDLPLDCLNVLLRLTILHPDDREDLTHLSERIDIPDVLSLPGKERLGQLLNLRLLGLIVGCVIDTATIGQSVVHGQLLLQVPDLLLEALNLQGWVHHGIHRGLIRDLHHAAGELERRCCFGEVARLRPDVRNHYSLAVAADGVAEEVCQFRLTVGDVASFLVREGQDDLLKEGKRLVDEARLFQDEALRARLLGHLTASKIDEVQLGVDDFVG